MLGWQVQNLHESYQRFLKDNTPKATGAVDKAQAVLACLALLERLKETEQHWDILRAHSLAPCFTSSRRFYITF